MKNILLQRGVVAVFLAVVAVQFAVSLLQQQWLEAFIAMCIALATPLPFLIARAFGLHLPTGLRMLILAFLCGWLYLGEIHGFYERFAWWDTLLHILAGVVVSVAGFLMAHHFAARHDRPRRAFMALFAFVFSLAIGALWEVFEFTMDGFFGLDMQEAMFGDSSGLTDTMMDLVADAAGAASVSLYAYYHMRKGDKQTFLERWLEALTPKNRKPRALNWR